MVGVLRIPNSMNLQSYKVNEDLEGIKTNLLMDNIDWYDVLHRQLLVSRVNELAYSIPNYSSDQVYFFEFWHEVRDG